MIEFFLNLNLLKRDNIDSRLMSIHNSFFHKWFPTKRCVRAIERAKFLGQCTPWDLSRMVSREANLYLKHHQVWGLGMNGMENRCEVLFKAPSTRIGLRC